MKNTTTTTRTAKNTTATPNPVRAPGHDDPEAIRAQRRLLCTQYDRCLDYAAKRDWPSFFCGQCRYTKRLTDQQERAARPALMAVVLAVFDLADPADLDIETGYDLLGETAAMIDDGDYERLFQRFDEVRDSAEYMRDPDAALAEAFLAGRLDLDDEEEDGGRPGHGHTDDLDGMSWFSARVEL